MIYFDNAATTYKKPDNVVRAVRSCIRKYSANPGRGAHKLALLASEAVFDARERVAHFFSTDSAERVIFTYNTTYALNLAIKTIVEPGSHVLISNLEHNSALRPVHKLKDTVGVRYDVFDAMAGDLHAEITKCITQKTSTIICTAASNVTGYQIPLGVLSDIKRKYGVKLIIDGAQAAGHKKIDLGGIDFDAFAFLHIKQCLA